MKILNVILNTTLLFVSLNISAKDPNFERIKLHLDAACYFTCDVEVYDLERDILVEVIEGETTYYADYLNQSLEFIKTDLSRNKCPLEMTSINRALHENEKIYTRFVCEYFKH